MKDTTFTLEEDTYLTLRLQPLEANVPTTLTNIQIERGETVTTYEAYQSRYYKPRETEEIILRSLPNGVCDTFNLQTGELVQRIHSHVFDGATYELNFMNTPGEVSGDDVVGGWSSLYNMYAPKHNSFSVSCDIPTRQRTSTSDSDYVNKEFFMVGINTFVISLSKTRLNGLSISQYLKSNPITVQYELEEPIITKLQTYNRVYSGQTNALASMGNNLSALTYRYSTDYLKVGNLSPVPAILEPITTIPYDVRLKPSTLYTVKYNRGGNSSSMKFDLGGSVVEKTNATDLGIVAEEFTVRTPAILSHEQLILSGTGYAHNFIIVEGDITGTELPYFESMKDVKMPIVRNCGKNLFDGELYINYGIQINGTTSGEPAIPGLGTITDWVTTKNHIPVKKGDIISIAIDANDSDITSHRRYTYVYKYDTQKQFIVNDRYDLGVSTKTFTVAHNGYIRCTIKTHNVNNISITKENTPSMEQYRGNDICIVKNGQDEIRLSQNMFEQGGIDYPVTNTITYEQAKANSTLKSSTRLRNKKIFKINGGKTYKLALNDSEKRYQWYLWRQDGKSLGITGAWSDDSNTFTVTVPQEAAYMSLLFKKANDSDITVNELNLDYFQLLELDSTVQLRSLPNGVKDELNLLTGEYIQRVGEVVLDGSQLRNHPYNGTFNNVYRLGIEHSAGNETVLEHHVVGYCDKLNNSYDWEGDYEHFYVGKSVVMLYINKEKIGELTDENVKTYLSQNPITVQYELAEPIISYPRIVSNTQEREVGVKLPNGVCDTYNPSTGITVKRVGKVVLDGSEDWEDGTLSNDTYYEGWLPNSPFAKTMKPVTDISFINGNFVTMFVADGAIPHFNSLNSLIHGGINIKNTSNPPDPGATSFIIQKSKMTTPTLDGFKQYLASNPITVWYELKNPIVTTDIVLPNGVHDEYNPLTGLYTKRVGYVELDGSEDWHDTIVTHASGAIDMYSMWTEQPLANAKSATATVERMPGVCDSLKFKNASLDSLNEEFYFISYTGRFNMNLKRSKLSEPTEQALKTYLSQNPIKLWYELATPITYQLTPYFGLPMPYAYKDGYLIMDSAYDGQTLPPEITYQLTVNRTGQITQNNIKLQNHTSKQSNLEAMLVEATLQSMYEREMMAFNLEMVNINLINLEE